MIIFTMKETSLKCLILMYFLFKKYESVNLGLKVNG